MKTSTSLVLALGLLGTGVMVAGADDRNIGAVEQRQRARIRKGAREGDLTHREARHLRREENQVESDRERALADGRIDRHERRHIRREQRQLNDQIYHERHDDQER